MKFLLFVLAVVLGGAVLPFAAGAQEIPVRQETLGQWHYLHPLDEALSNPNQTPPMTISFGPSGSRAAVLLPGSKLVAEFKDGHFFDLRFPTDLRPCSLAVDNQGRLYALGQKVQTTITNWTSRWVASLDGSQWSHPQKVPFDVCDQIDFDSQNRLWALGPARVVAVKQGGGWDTFSYSDDKNLRFAPIRLTSNAAGDPVLFAYWRPLDMSRLVGTLTYHAGHFVRDALADTTTLIKAQTDRDAASSTLAEGRSVGFVARMNRGDLRPASILRWNGYTIVSLDTEGLAWTGPADVTSPPLSVEKEWEPKLHVEGDPALDPHGNLWVLQNDPARLLEVTATQTQEFAIPSSLVPNPEPTTIDFDPLGRPWLDTWHGDIWSVLVFDNGKFDGYKTMGAALHGEVAKFSAGRIFPFATKSPLGTIAYGGWNGQSTTITVVDGSAVTSYAAQDIDPDEPSQRPTTGHGYNAFRGSDVWLDKDGFLHVQVLGRDFRYASGKWAPSPLTQGKDSVIPALPIMEKLGPIASVDASRVAPWDTSNTVFRGFHFYRTDVSAEKQLDFGLNPLATYPFFSGLISATLDPQGRIWTAVPDGRPEATWYVERK